MNQPQSRIRSIVINGVLSLVAFGLLGLTVWKNWDKIHEVLDRPLNVKLIALAFGVYLVPLVLTFFRWFVLVRALDIPFRVRDAIELGFIGNVFNLVIPGAVGGDVIKAAFLCQRMHTKRTQAVASMVIDRIIGLLALFILAGIAGAMLWSTATLGVQYLILFAWVAVGIGFASLAVLFTPALYMPLERLVRGRGRLEILLTELVAMAGAYRKRLGTIAAMIVLGVVIHSLFVISFYIVSLALFPEGVPSLGKHFLMVALTLFSTAVPLPFGALGLSENVSSQLFRLVGHPNGAVAMMGYRVIMYAGGLVSILVYLANLRQVRDLSAETGPLDGSEPVPEPVPIGS